MRWSRGPLPEADLLLGRSVLFWGRLGKGLQLVAGLPVVFDLLGAAALDDFGRRYAERLRAARTRVTATRGAAQLLERLRALESRVKSDLTATRREPGTPEYESLLASLAGAFDGEFTCASCRYAMPQYAVVDDLPVSSPDRPVPKWECVHGRNIFESQVESAFVDGLSEKDRTAWRNAEDVSRWVEPIGSILLGGLVLGSLALVIVEWRTGWERPGLLVAVPIAVVILAVLASVVTDPGKRRRAGAILAWLWVVVCYLPVPMTRSIVWVMNRERPAHPLRWIALGLFIFGSLLDLLAS
ncbi:hypothetical protein DFR68_10212 [Nocardia mexicana]|uniref:Uncharacterized protein n=1 Tax=Nocardia mexicana TaxID=279262 RepID=A0A370HAC4_9NOCA|nr:hypothetical protein DFR68_10212 [Nocardia mexicana]